MSEIIIETERLLMRPWNTDDAADLFRYASDSRVAGPAHWPRHESEEMSREVIERFFLPNPMNFAMVLKTSGRPVGCIGLVLPGEENVAVRENEREVGYWIGYPFWGEGLTSEALRRMILFFRDTLGLRSLVLTADSGNAASRRVAEKCGFRYVGDFSGNSLSGVAYRLDLK